MPPLNYAAHAVEQLHADRQRVIGGHPELDSLYETVIELLCESIKFILPNRAELIDLSELRQAHVDMARLPYPVVALDATWTFADGRGGSKQGGERSTKRIALCMTLTAELAERIPGTKAFLDEAEGGVLMIPISWGDAEGRWKLPLGGVFFPYQNKVTDYVPGEVCPVTRMAGERVIDLGVSTKQLKTFRALPFNLIPSGLQMAARSCPWAGGW